MELTLMERARQLRSTVPQIEATIKRACRGATLRAIEKAAELTPPTQDDDGDDLRGTSTRSGEMKQHWATDSKPEPRKTGSAYKTTLANDMEYASYVNDGHRMDRHFVPGLYIDPESGLLEYAPGAKVGIVVGTKTTRVPGIFMVDEAKKEYKRVLRRELGRVREVIE